MFKGKEKCLPWHDLEPWSPVWWVHRALAHLMMNSKQVNFLLRLSWYLSGRESACQCRRHRFDPWVAKKPLEEEIAIHPSIFAWEISWTEEPGWQQSVGSRKSWTGLKDETTASKTSSLDFFKLESYKCLSLCFVFFFFFNKKWKPLSSLEHAPTCFSAAAA